MLAFYRRGNWFQKKRAMLFAALVFVIALFVTACSPASINESETPAPVDAPIEALAETPDEAASPAVTQAAPPAVTQVSARTPRVLVPQTGNASTSRGGATIDTSNAADGYVMISYSGASTNVRVRISKDDVNYNFTLNTGGGFETFPLSLGDGTYTIGVFEHIRGNQFAMTASTTVNVTLNCQLRPFLYPNQFVNFNANSAAVAKAASLAEGAADELEIVSRVFNFVIANIKYDTDLAKRITSGEITTYIPNVDNALATGKGICFDYAALMAAMLRSQLIPTQLQIGYVSGGLYHAWISVYITDIGWVNNVIQFDGRNWTLMDPTFAAGGDANFVGTGAGYQMVFRY